MRKTGLFIAVLSLAILMTSCSGVYNVSHSPSASVTPDIVRLNIDYNNVKYLGEVSIEVNSTVYLGIIRDIRTVNGVNYDFRNVKNVYFKGKKEVNMPRVMDKATYKVVETYPDADFYVPVSCSTQKQRMFLGRNETTKVVVRAYKYNK